MENENFKKRLESLGIPETDNVTAPDKLKITLFSAKKTAALGVWLIAIPAYFLFCVFMKYYFHYDLHLFDIVIEMIASLDKKPGFHFLSPLLLVGLPLICVVLNLLAIIHFNYDELKKELLVSIKIKWLNIFLIFISLAMAAVFLLYAIIENANHS